MKTSIIFLTLNFTIGQLTTKLKVTTENEFSWMQIFYIHYF